MQVKNKISKLKVGKLFKYIVLATNIIAIVILLLSILAWYIVPSKISIIAYLGLAFPIILFVNILYLILWIITFRWRYVIVQLVIILICWLPVTTCFPVHLKTKEKDIPENRFKVLTYNVRAFNWEKGEKARENPIIKYLVESNADIICLQEFAVSTTKNKSWIISEEELSSILKDYPYHEIIKLGTSRGSLAYGLACYSKFPIEKASRLPLESSYNGSAMYELTINKKKVILVNNHLESNRITAEDKRLYKDFFKTRDKEIFEEVAMNIQSRLGAAYKIREVQAETIRSLIDKQNSNATIVCGDFNDSPISFAYYTVKGDLVDSYANTGFGPGITYNEHKFWFRIDYIMHSVSMQSYNCTVDKIKYSDHYPVWTYLAFR
ncbi:MAG: endonuclease/exonuclease/phosphatase family protein [Prevotella sp.]|jgi:endonuclease/exonuclease/phosphatase family metal-dependent hydrolase|nr:endonuclease/exonuclease/phosphatase family protein [Prevotella sp.]